MKSLNFRGLRNLKGGDTQHMNYQPTHILGFTQDWEYVSVVLAIN